MIHNDMFRSFFRTIGRILAYIFIGFLISLFIGYLKPVKAQENDFYLNDFRVNNKLLDSSFWLYFNSGNQRFSFALVPYNFQPQQNLYISILVCSETEFSGGFGDAGTSNFNAVNTNKSCKFPNSSFAGGKIKILNFNLKTGVGNEFSGGVSFYTPKDFSITLISFNVSSSNFISVNDLPTDIDLTDTNDKLDKANDKLDKVNDSIKDETPPNLKALDNSAGWLPVGPVDSILNLPLSFLNNLSTNLSKTCQPVNLPLPYVDKNLELPCVNSVYSQIEGLQTWINGIGIVASVFILFYYFINLYKWVDDTLSFRENNWQDWGGI